MHLFKSKILANPKGIVWDQSKTEASISISECGLKLNKTLFGVVSAIATKGCTITGGWEHCREENSHIPGTIFYYEVTMSR
jgi:hypothetical protein